MRTEDQILNFLKYNGPSLTMKISKHVGEDSLITSAYLSEMVSQRKIKISDLKIGTSPLYLLPGQENQLIHYISEFKAKDQEVLEKLRKYGVLREADQELLAKVALRKVKDFAQPLQVNIQGQKELFWKWYMLNEEETNAKISELLGATEEPEIKETETVQEEQAEEQYEAKEVLEEKAEEPVIEKTPEPKQEQKKTQTYPPNTSQPKPEPETVETYPPNTSEKEEVKENEPAYPPVTSEEEIKENVEEQIEGEEEKEVIEETKEPEPVKENLKVEEKEDTEKEEPAKEKQKVLTEDHDKNEKDSKPKKSIVAKIKDKITGNKKRKKVEENFLPTIMKFLAELNIDIESHEIIRKNAEFNLTIRVPSVVGKLTYHCKAKKKKNCDEKDLSAAYMESQMKKMPLLFLYSEKINKKAEELLDSGTFDNLIAKRIELDEEEKTLLK